MIQKLHLGVRDRKIALLKQLLNEICGSSVSLPTNDYLDGQTHAVLARWQQQNGIFPADGAVDEDTWITIACELSQPRLRRLLEELKDSAYTQLLKDVQGYVGVADGLLTNATQTKTPKQTCLLEFVKANGKTATELSRHFVKGHDGRHVVSPIKTGSTTDYGGDVITIAPLEDARVLRWNVQDAFGQWILDLQLSNGQVLTLKDLGSVEKWVKAGLEQGKTHGVKVKGSKVQIGLKIKAGDVGRKLGTIYADAPHKVGNEEKRDLYGLHISIVKDRESWDKWLKQGRKGKEGNVEWFVDALDPKGLFACPNYRNQKGERRTEEGYDIP